MSDAETTRLLVQDSTVVTFPIVKMSKKPTEKFAFGGNFTVGEGQAGEDKNAIKVVSWMVDFLLCQQYRN